MKYVVPNRLGRIHMWVTCKKVIPEAVTTEQLVQGGGKKSPSSQGIPIANGLREEDKPEKVTKTFWESVRQRCLSTYSKNN